MNRLTTSIIALIIVATSAVATYSYLPDYLSKKMNRHLVKIYGRDLTYKEISLNDSLTLNHQAFRILKDDTLSGFSIITRALGCQIGGCDKPAKDTTSFEQFFFVTAFDKHKNIKRVRILEYTSNHGYQIASRGWLKQFEKGKSFQVGKNIDVISGATISVNSITQNVNEQLAIIHSMDRE
ncbi:MAG: hypothetical protein COA58_14775 [Bacteroidetes bacterium]|nr:MAG: hypothetical protein COA58_14775 [Bacteroidota bacterium]